MNDLRLLCTPNLHNNKNIYSYLRPSNRLQFGTPMKPVDGAQGNEEKTSAEGDATVVVLDGSQKRYLFILSIL